MQLHTQFSSRASLATYVRQQFPSVAAYGPEISPTHGGRRAAETRLQQLRPQEYAATRNMLKGAVTHLSPYLRYGIVTLAEVRRVVLEHTPKLEAYKLLQELAWRDYYQRVYQRLMQYPETDRKKRESLLLLHMPPDENNFTGRMSNASSNFVLSSNIWYDIEPYKTGVIQYAQSLPVDIEQGKTGLACIDAFAHELRETGYLHNHARMWTAAYVIHHRRVRWQAGAFWFLQHLLDGDPASNNLSWQWVASTFAAKPYYFDRQNLAHYTENAFCAACPLAHHGCPFDESYEGLAARLFPASGADAIQRSTTPTALMQQLANRQEHEKDIDSSEQLSAQETIVWLHEESLHPYGPALQAHPEAPRIFIFDEAALEDAQWTLKRVMFVYECLLEIPAVLIYKGSPTTILRELVEQRQRQSAEKIVIATTRMLDPRLQHVLMQLKESIHVQLYEIEPYIASREIKDLRSFSRYWNQAKAHVIDRKEEKEETSGTQSRSTG